MNNHVTSVNFTQSASNNMATDCKPAVGRASYGRRLLSWGANSYGQLSQGHREDQLLPGEVTHTDLSVSSISGGGGHTLVIDDEGQLYTCGSNNKGQLGLGNTQDVSALTRVKVPVDDTVTMATGGWDFTIFISGSGDLFSMGSNAFGQLGLPGVNQVTVPTKVQIPNDEKVIDVAAGLRHVVMVTEGGHVYCWGAGRKGQCGVLMDNKPPAKQNTPCKVNIPETGGRVCSVVAGSHHSLACTDQGEVLAWGCNKYGQCLQDPEDCTSLLIPTLVPSGCWEGRITNLHSGWTHLLALTDKGSLYSWGRSDYGQLGRSCDKSYDHRPKSIPGLSSVKTFSCGSEHNLSLSDDGIVSSWGWNEHGICGTGNEDNVNKPHPVAALSKVKVTCIGCGNGHSMVFGSQIT